MSHDLQTHVLLSDQDRPPGTPQLSLNITVASPRLSLTLPYYFYLTISRAQVESDDRPVLFQWRPDANGFTASGFKLLHHTSDGLKELEIDHSGVRKDSAEGDVVVNGWNLEQLSPGGSTLKFMVSLPPRYHQLLVPGERYSLMWPGDKVPKWEWGTAREHMGQTFKNKTDTDIPLILPGGPHISFTAETESEPWPERAEREAKNGFMFANLAEEGWRRDKIPPRGPSPVLPSHRDERAPKLSVVLECPPTLPAGGRFKIAVKVTYNAEPTAQPIIFHTYVFGMDGNFWLYRRRGEDWEICVMDGYCRFAIYDDPDVSINVSQDDDRFVSLSPDESWSTMQTLEDDGCGMPGDTKAGDVFRYVFEGDTVDWWDWGSKAKHKETVVMLPCFLSSKVIDPKDNGGRPKLVVLPSNGVEFSVVE